MLFGSLLIIIYSLRKRVSNFVAICNTYDSHEDCKPGAVISLLWVYRVWLVSILTSRCIVALQATHRLALRRVSFCRFVFLRFIKLYYGTLYNVYLCTCFPEWLHSKTKSLNRTSNPSIWDNAPSFCKKMPSLWFSGCLTVGCSQNMGCNLPQWAWWCILQWPVVLYWLVCWVSKEGINNWRPFLKVKSNLWKASDVQIQFMIFKQREQKWWHHKNQLCEIMGMIGISSKNKMKNVHLPKSSCKLVGRYTL